MYIQYKSEKETSIVMIVGEGMEVEKSWEKVTTK